MNNPFDYTPDEACDEAFRKLSDRLEALKLSVSPEDVNFCRELEAGKMLGVLIAADRSGARHTLYAFSGQMGHGGFHYPGFVGPVFDYLNPDGYFKTHEALISRQNPAIARFEEGAHAKAKIDYERAKERLDAEVAALKEECRLSKAARDAIRESEPIDDAEAAAMIRRSQFEKAELRRLKKSVAERLEPFADKLRETQSHLDALKEKRRADSEALQQWLFSEFRLLNARGESRSLSEIFAETTMRVPPSGAGECCAPKLLHAANLRGWQPLSIAEYWYGKPKGGEVRRHGEHYPACHGKCLPVLRWMLQGLTVDPPLGSEYGADRMPQPEIIYENRWFCVVDKPSGMLSVPGKGAALSLQQWLVDKYGADKDVKVAHRLDQDTSGLIIATFGPTAFKIMQSLFASRNVSKSYAALLEGDYKSFGLPQNGRISLPLTPDWLDRPRQRVDIDKGKEAVTEYEFTGVAHGRSRIEFHPLTGRTHQLRVHAASESGLGLPIVGDRLYGKNGGSNSARLNLHTARPNLPNERLHLHAQKISFTFPLDARRYTFESPAPF